MTMADQQEYQVTARKWRPAEFESVVGQEHVTQTLRNALRSGRLHHAYLFSGPRGVGKTTTARILAKALNCMNPGEDFEPCNRCEACLQIVQGRSLDVVEIDGASNNSVEDIRKLRDNAKYPPVHGSYKLYIIDEVHMLSTSAFNALLKTLEEPPKHLIFIFATTEPHKVPATILSRCQRFDFRRMQIADIVGRLAYIATQEGMNVEEDALVVIAKKGDGSMRDSQSIFDQVTAFCGTTVTYAQANEALNLIDQEFYFRVTDLMRLHDTAEAFAIVERIMRVGYDPQEFLVGLAEHLRNYLTVITTGSVKLIEAAKVHLNRYAEEGKEMESGDMIRALHLVLAAQQAIRTSPMPRLRLELALVQLAVMDSTISLTKLLEKIDGIPASGPSSPAPSSASPAPRPAQRETSETGGNLSASAGSTSPPAAPAGSASVGSAPVGAVDMLASFPVKAPAKPAPRYPEPQNGSRPTGATLVGGGSAVEGTVGVAESATAYGTAGSVPSLSEIRGRWSEFVTACTEDRKMLGTLLQSAQPAELYGSTLRLYLADQTTMMMLKQEKEYLVGKLREIYRAPLLVDGEVGRPPSPVRNGNGLEQPAGAHDHHPFIRGLVDKLGATRF